MQTQRVFATYATIDTDSETLGMQPGNRPEIVTCTEFFSEKYNSTSIFLLLCFFIHYETMYFCVPEENI